PPGAPGVRRPPRAGRRPPCRRGAAPGCRARYGSIPVPSCAPSDRLRRDLRHPDRRDALTVSAAPAIVLPALLLVDEDLPVPPLGHDLAAYHGTLDQRPSHAHRRLRTP